MIRQRLSVERGHTNLGWLDSRHTFSFDRYYDERYMGFRHLRALNEDRVKPGAGFGTHSHRDMEIISYVLDGALEHKDSTGTNSLILPDEVQRMSAGTGISHSEYNHSKTEPVHFLQMWILPEKRGLQPGYEQRQFKREEKQGRLRLVASRDGRDGALTVHQDVKLYVALLDAQQEVVHRLKTGRHAWLQAARGGVELNGATLSAGDGAAVSEEEMLKIRASEAAEILLFDLA